MKRALSAQFGVAGSRPASAAATAPSPAAAAGGRAGALPPITKRWMKAPEFAQFAYALVTDKFHAIETDDTAGAGSAADGLYTPAPAAAAGSVASTPADVVINVHASTPAPAV